MATQLANDLRAVRKSAQALFTTVSVLWNQTRREVQRDWTAVTRDFQQVLDSLEESVNAGRAVFAAIPRARLILSTVARIAIAYRTTPRGRIGKVHDRSARQLRDLCEECGGAVLKFGQFLACRPDILPDAYVEALGPLCHKAPSVPMTKINAVLAEELGERDVFRTLDTEPLGTGSLAQVHRAVLMDGRDVAVKVQLPDVESVVKMDLAILRAAAVLFKGVLPEEVGARILNEFCRAVEGELNFETEAEDAAAFTEMFADWPRVHVPGVVAELSTRRVLVMELAEGTPLVEALPEDSAEDRARVLGLWLDSVLYQVLEAGLVHGDPHPGNFLRTKSGELVILDFGCVAKLEPAIRHAYLETVAAVVRNDGKTLQRALHALGFKAADQTALADVATQLLLGLRDPAHIEQMRTDPGPAVQQVLESLRAAGEVDVPEHFVLIARVLGSVAGQIIEYGQELDVTKVAMTAVARAMASRSSTSQAL